MTEEKEASPVSSLEDRSCPVSSQESDSRSNNSGSDGMPSVHHKERHLHLQVPSRSNSSSSQSSPRIYASRERGSSIGSTFSTEQNISYRDLSDIEDEFKIVKILHNGKFSRTFLVKPLDETIPLNKDNSSEEEESSGEKLSTIKKLKKGGNRKYLVLKAIQSDGLFTDDFKRELRYNYFLSPHPNIVTSFNISFNWASIYNAFVQEHAPYGDLNRILNNQGRKGLLLDFQVKLIASQIASALEFMHSMKLVHQNIQPENILVFKLNFSRVKLCDFGTTRKEGTIITKGILLPSSLSHCSYLPPELSYLFPQEKYECHQSCDVWQFGILLCVCLTGASPWTYADFADPVFRQYTNWLKRKSLKLPEPFKKFSPRLIRLLKRLLEPKSQFRSEIREVFKYLTDEWIRSSYCRRNNHFSITRKIATKMQEIKEVVVSINEKVNKQDSLDKTTKSMLRTPTNEVEESTVKRIEEWVTTSVNVSELPV